MSGGKRGVFREACTIARNFTLPVVTSIRTVDGRCASGSASFVVINDEGWIVTAAHVIKQFADLSNAEQKTRALETQAASNPRMNRRDRRAARSKGPSKDDIDAWAPWWGRDGFQLDMSSVRIVEVADVAVGKLTGFDASAVGAYPVFKDPARDFEPGTSLCRYGFPFIELPTSYDPARKHFALAGDQIPIFPNEGIFCRIRELIVVNSNGKPLPAPPFPLRMFETSSPGIKGQSGGPIFDSRGSIWGIQSATTSYKLDFSTTVEQFYHVGLGVHVMTILGLMNEMNVRHTVSTY